MQNRLRIGTRGSELALWQARHVQFLLAKKFPHIGIEIEIVKTTGDSVPDAPLAQIGGKGLFTKELELALLDRRIDLAVHSLKDVPTSLPDGLLLGAILERDDVRDVLICHRNRPHMRFKDLPPNAVIATGSLRRTCQILHARPDLHIVDLRGNIHTRIKKLDESAWSGIVLAKAGIARLGVEERIAEVLPLDLLLPAVGQGAVALEIRATDDIVRPYVDAIHSHDTAVAVNAERAVLRTLEGGCQVPLGALARAQGTMLHLDAIIGSIDGTRIIKASQVGTTADPERLGVSVAEELLLNGGNEILHEIRNGRAGT